MPYTIPSGVPVEAFPCGLPEPAPSVRWDAPLAAVVDMCLANDRHDWVILADALERPVALIERAPLLLGMPFEHRPTILSAPTSREDVLRQALGRRCEERHRPLVCCDALHRYRGILRMETLLRSG